MGVDAQLRHYGSQLSVITYEQAQHAAKQPSSYVKHACHTHIQNETKWGKIYAAWEGWNKGNTLVGEMGCFVN